MNVLKYFRNYRHYWTRFWMLYAGTPFGGAAILLASLFVPPYHERKNIARYNPQGYISPTAKLYHTNLEIGRHVFIDDRALIYQHEKMGEIIIGDNVVLQHDVILETGQNGSITLENEASLAFRCHLASYAAPIVIGPKARIASGCSFHAQDHGDSRKEHWQLKTKGPIIVKYGAWVGTNSIILSGVTIGQEAAIAAGSVVTKDIPDKMIAAGNPARILKKRGE